MIHPRFALLVLLTGFISVAQAAFTLEQVRDYPYHESLTAAATGSRIAWASNFRGQRNIWIAEGPKFSARQLTHYSHDDGEELTSIVLSADGKYVVYVRGGEHGSNWDAELPVNAASAPLPGKVQVWSVAFAGGEPQLLGEGDYPQISPQSDRVAFVKDKGIWSAAIDGEGDAKEIVKPKGASSSLAWSPDGSQLAFSVERPGHALIGVYRDPATPIKWLAPSLSKDDSPVWSLDGTRVAFIRRPGSGGVPEPSLTPNVRPWSLWIADVNTGEGKLRWSAPLTLSGSIVNDLYWAASERIVINSYAGGWQQLYSLPASKGEPVLLTPGNYMVENSALSADRRHVVMTVNTGPDADDIDRRHIMRVSVEKGPPQQVTSGKGLEWSPVITGDGKTVAYFSATSQRPASPAVQSLDGGKAQLLAETLLPSTYPQTQLVTPRSVTFKAADGVTVHGQLFEPRDSKSKHPAVVYLHGGPQRQMLLGWHASGYYSNAYAINQYLASRGFVVLSVNYRLGIGYGYDVHFPLHSGVRGAAEVQDVVAGGKYLQALPQVDAKRVGLYGGSYGGYLTAMALGRHSDLFAAGVDIHGVHDWTSRYDAALFSRQRFEMAPDAQQAIDVGWQSSPVSTVNTWKSPVLFIHGDDDRNVPFTHTVDLARRLDQQGVAYEYLVLPDETHHSMRFDNELKIDRAIVEFLERKLRD